MNIPVNHLKKFQKLASTIKGSNILSMHGYLKFGNSGICKNVNTSFIQYGLPEADEEILVSEHDLYSLLAVTSSSFININLKKGKVELNDGKDKIFLPMPNIKEFNEPPKADTDPVKLSEDFMDALFNASNFALMIKDMPTHYGFVHINEGTVCAGDGIMAYHCPVEEKFKAVIEGTIAKFISKQSVHSFCESHSYNYFFTPDAIFGFGKSEIGWFDIRRLFAMPRKFSFTIDAADISSFNNLSLQLSKTALVTVSEGKLEMTDILFDKYHERPADNIKSVEPFSYNPERMNIAMNGIGLNEIDMSDGGPCYFLSNKEVKATTIIAKIKKD